MAGLVGPMSAPGLQIRLQRLRRPIPPGDHGGDDRRVVGGASELRRRRHASASSRSARTRRDWGREEYPRTMAFPGCSIRLAGVYSRVGVGLLIVGALGAQPLQKFRTFYPLDAKDAPAALKTAGKSATA